MPLVRHNKFIRKIIFPSFPLISRLFPVYSQMSNRVSIFKMKYAAQLRCVILGGHIRDNAYKPQNQHYRSVVSAVKVCRPWNKRVDTKKENRKRSGEKRGRLSHGAGVDLAATCANLLQPTW